MITFKMIAELLKAYVECNTNYFTIIGNYVIKEFWLINTVSCITRRIIKCINCFIYINDYILSG